MKLSERVRADCPRPDDIGCNCGMREYADEVKKLEAKLKSCAEFTSVLTIERHQLKEENERYKQMLEYIADKRIGRTDAQVSAQTVLDEVDATKEEADIERGWRLAHQASEIKIREDGE